MTVSDFVNAAQIIANRIKYYLKDCGGLTPDGGCDCIGLIKEAYTLAGGRWNAGTGSNASARYMMQGLEIANAGTLAEGMVVYKLRPPGDPGWRLPDTYRGHPDQNDYYHIGVVVTVHPLQILHCTTVQGGKKVDSSVGDWKKCGFLKGVDRTMAPISRDGWKMVDYGREITSENGGNVNLRSGPGTNYSVVKSLKVGTEVEVRYEVDETWAQVYTGGVEGYVMRKYLKAPETQAAQTYAEPISAQGEIERVYSGLTESQAGRSQTEILMEIREALSILIERIDAGLHG